MKNMKIWMNGRLVDTKDAKVSVFDRGFLYGDGVFETMRCYAGRVFRLDAHLSRLFASLEMIKMRPPYGKRCLKDAIYGCLEANALNGAYIRLQITRGKGIVGLFKRGPMLPTVVIMSKKFEDYTERMRKRGLSARVAGLRQNEYSPLSRIKSLSFLNHILARLSAQADGFDEAILMNTKGRIAEAATSNIFLTKKNTVITPGLDSGILPGITRGVVIEIAKALKLKVREKAVSYKEMISADEVFLTNSLAEVLPVTKVDSAKIGSGRPGSLTKLIHISYQKQVIRESLDG
ncbi:MAG: aminotransferase class IV [Candidatus Omnitrophota bacterium]|nr:aminotransferase class IV [Candidatus Omnitrophota bacterium]